MRPSTSLAQMPKLGGMAQISRPFQIVLVVVCLFAGVWLFALHGHSSSAGSSTPSPAVSTSTSPAPAEAAAKAAPKPAQTHGGSSLGGLSHAIAKAHGAAAISQHNAQQVEQKSAQASGEPSKGATTAAHTGSSAHTGSTVHTGSSATTTGRHTAVTAPTAVNHAAVKTQSTNPQTGAGRTPARQVLVERALDEGKVAVILFWNPKGTEDTIVNNELQVLEAVHHLIRPLARTPQVRQQLKASGLESEKPFAAFQSTASQVASYGSITRGVQIYATPTILVINKSGQTTVLSGLQDAFSIEQAIDEARSS
jgi:hypothetical protein